MRRRDFLALVGASVVLAVFPAVAIAQLAGKVPRIAVLSTIPPAQQIDGIRVGLMDYGYVDGSTMRLEWFIAPAVEDLIVYAAKAIDSRPDLILSNTTPATLALKKLTGAVPIVMTGNNDPVGNGTIAGLAKPGANITGLSATAPDAVAKQFGILKEIMPTLKRVAILNLPADPSSSLILAQVNAATDALGIETAIIDFSEDKDFAQQLDGVLQTGAEALYTLAVNYFGTKADAIYKFEVAHKLPRLSTNPAMVPFQDAVGYGPDTIALRRQAGAYVDAILKGANPADLPVAQPTKFDLAINLATAKAVGITIPTSVFVQATVVFQ